MLAKEVRFGMLQSVKTIVLCGKPLDFGVLEEIGVGLARPVADDSGMDRVAAAHKVVADRVAMGLPVYGSNTGVGSMKDRLWTADDLAEFNTSLVRAHHFGTGEFFAAPIIRKAIAIRVNTAMRGHTGCSPELINAFLALLERGIVPAVRRHGSMGCADIGLMGQVASVLTGVGDAYFNGQLMTAESALKEAGLSPFVMRPRDALAALSVNAISYAAAADVLREAAAAIRVLLVTGVMSSRALGASADPWLVAATLSTRGEALVGSWLYGQSGIADWPLPTAIHDPLSLRMTAQVFGAVVDTLLVAAGRLVEATYLSDDNPVVLGGQVHSSGASLPLTTTLYIEAAQVAFSHVARNVLNRCILLSNGGRRNLSVNLVAPGEVATGLGPLMKLAVELYMRVQSLAVPLSAQSIVVAGGLEEEATFLPLIVERMETQVRDLRQLAAIEAMLSAQAMDLVGDEPWGVVKLAYDRTRSVSPIYLKDRPLSKEIEALQAAFTDHDLSRAFVETAPMPEFDDFFALAK
ncbi:MULTISPECIES: aromatic amino acid lyase [Sinorhizobium]|uniref:Aromatic amino acid lyase n=1 Tax=Sinorhizobium psoraleae TaxID=520838 RepID=A0ABT4KJC3_9HYPH|nr:MULTISPECIES: aromatic amino acid lyase [Sinorhizobium]MCZ4092078.1 aromatic amino acid lyase [Sinorhizobium psoraleae]MDK1387088.1 aromatic amino acid lyase [Sinorhizobium sp. 7-81]